VGALVRGADVEGDREIVEGIVLGDRLHLFGSLGQEDPMPEGELREGRDDLPLGPLPGGSLLEDFLSLLKLPFLGRGQADRCHLCIRGYMEPYVSFPLRFSASPGRRRASARTRKSRPDRP